MSSMAIICSKMIAFGQLRSMCLVLLVLIASCSPPQDPIKCTSNNSNCTITNFIGSFSDRRVCRAASAAYPTTEQELISIIANATMTRRKIKVATRYGHSMPKLVCPDGQDGFLVSTKNLNRILKIDFQAMTMTVESGVTLRQIINESAKVGLALPCGPYFWGLSIGGLLSTGAHGSTLWSKGSAVHEYVVELRIVSPGKPEDGYVKVRVLNESDPDLDAAKVSLGVLGVLSRLQPLFKRSMTRVEKNDSDLGGQVVSFGNQHEFADIYWYPSQRKASYRIDDRVPLNTSGNGLYDNFGFRSMPSLILAGLRTTEEIQEAINDAQGKCTTANLITTTLRLAANGLTNNGFLFTGYPVIGFQNRLQAYGTCLDSAEDGLATACGWDPRIKGQFYFQTSITVGVSVVKSFIEDVQKLVALEPRALCDVEINSGILIRYIKRSSAYLGKQEDCVDFDNSYYRSKDPMTPRLYEDIIEEIEQMALVKYGGLPHWGKNRELVFDGVRKKYKNAGEFLKVKEKYDPLGLFSNEWTDRIFGLKNGVTTAKEGCAIEGLCICSQDIHCAPDKGYFCRPGKIYKDARVCTRTNT